MCNFFFIAVIINSYGQLPSPVSNQVLALSNANWYAQGAVSGFPAGSFTVEGHVYFPSYPPFYDCVLLRKEGFCEVKISK